MHTVLLLLIIGLLVIFTLMYMNSKDSFNFNFDNADYQYSNPNLKREWLYYTLLNNDCKGNTYNYNCLENSKLKTFREGMMAPDIKDWVCYHARNNEQDYLKCLNVIYSNEARPDLE